MLKQLAAHPSVFKLQYDRPIKTYNYRTVGQRPARAFVQDCLGYTGAGIGIAVIDSGITTWHDDLTNKTSTLFPYGNQRVTKFVDFVNGRSLPYDDNGHGTHVAGIIAGNGYDSNGEKRGIAPDANIVSLKVLDHNGKGTISNIIAALDWVAANATDLQHPRRQPVGRRGDSRVVLDRPADAGGQADRRQGHHRRRGGRQHRQERRTASCSTAASRRRPTRRGC